MTEEPTLTHRDIIARDTFTLAEKLVFTLLLISAMATFWVGDPSSKWVLGGLLIAGGISIFILKTHEHTHIYHVELLWPKFWLLSAPMWLLLTQFLLGFLQDPTGSVEVEGSVWMLLKPVHAWLPVSSSRGFTILSFLGYCALYLIALPLFIVPKSRAFFERVLPWLCLIVSLLGIYGFIQESLELNQPIFTNGTGQTDFFAFFPYDGHWAAFATLWCAACVSLSLSTTLLKGTTHYLNSRGPWFLATATMLGFSGYWIEARWPAICLLITYASLLFCVSLHFITRSKDKDRFLIAFICTGLGLITLFSGISRFLAKDSFAQTASKLHQAGIEMFQELPIFGWGLDAYAKIAPYYLHDSLLTERYERPSSDVIQLLAEFGLFGATLIGALILCLFIRYLRGLHGFHMTNYLLIGCVSIMLLAIVDSPFVSPAVFLSFWILLFSALRWADLSRNRVDEVDARIIYVSDTRHRKAPVFSGEYKEQHK